MTVFLVSRRQLYMWNLRHIICTSNNLAARGKQIADRRVDQQWVPGLHPPELHAGACFKDGNSLVEAHHLFVERLCGGHHLFDQRRILLCNLIDLSDGHVNFLDTVTL